MKPMSRSMIRHAHAIAREVGARAVLVNADVVEEDQDIVDLIHDVDFRVILVTRKPSVARPEGWDDLCQLVRVPDLKMTRAGQIKVALLVAAAEGMIHCGERIVCTTGVDGSGRNRHNSRPRNGHRDRTPRQPRRQSLARRGDPGRVSKGLDPGGRVGIGGA